MTRAQGFQFCAMNDQFLDLLDRFRLMKLGSAICIIASPIAWILHDTYIPLVSQKPKRKLFVAA
jgi:hypothetical protein